MNVEYLSTQSPHKKVRKLQSMIFVIWHDGSLGGKAQWSQIFIPFILLWPVGKTFHQSWVSGLLAPVWVRMNWRWARWSNTRNRFAAIVDSAHWDPFQQTSVSLLLQMSTGIMCPPRLDWVLRSEMIWSAIKGMNGASLWSPHVAAVLFLCQWGQLRPYERGRTWQHHSSWAAHAREDPQVRQLQHDCASTSGRAFGEIHISSPPHPPIHPPLYQPIPAQNHNMCAWCSKWMPHNGKTLPKTCGVWSK